MIPSAIRLPLITGRNKYAEQIRQLREELKRVSTNYGDTAESTVTRQGTAVSPRRQRGGGSSTTAVWG